MNTPNVLWWCGFFVLAIYVQWLVPGLDALVIGLILVLQERRYTHLLWLLPLLIVLQEGMGSREFGGMVLWYVTIIGLFVTGRWLFEVENFLFVFLLSVCMGGAYFSILYVLAPLQNLRVDLEQAAQASLIQAVFIPCAWWLTYISRRVLLPLGIRGHEQAS